MPFSRLYPLSSDESDTKESEQLVYLGLGPANDGSDISSLPADADVPSETPDGSLSKDKACVDPL